MTEQKQSRRVIVDQFLETLGGPSASPAQLRESKERTRHLLESDTEFPRLQSEELSPIDTPARIGRLWRPALVLAAVLLVVVVGLRLPPPKPASSTAEPDFIATTAQGTQLRLGQTIQSEEDDSESIALSDGSRVELRGGTEVRVDRGDEGLRLELTKGAVIVTAAPQGAGHLAVLTRDCVVTVVGTVFSVHVESSGSRVSVLEGQVHVQQGVITKLLLSGQQMSTNPAMPLVPVDKEIAWSRNAPALTSLISVAAVIPSPRVQASLAPGSGLASIEGIVVRKGTDEPLSGVELELSRMEGTSAAPLAPGVAELFGSILHSTSLGLPASGAAPPALLAPEVKYGKTGSDGKFAFRDLKEGKYRLVAVRGGGEYFPVEYGQRDLMQRGLNFPVAAGQVKKDIKLEMTPTGAISGRVVDEDGQPMGHVLVMALTAPESAGEQKPEIERVVLTDERGEYRIYWLGPGKYHVAAVYEDPNRRTVELAPQGPPARTIARERATSPVVISQLLPDGSVIEETYSVVYLGGTVDHRTARTVDVFSGETSAGADIPMGAGKMRTYHIRGVVVNGDNGQPAGGVPLLAFPRQRRPNALVLRGTSNADGTFDLAGAFSEGYVLTANHGIFPQPGVSVAGSMTQVGYASLDVAGGDATNVRVIMRSEIPVTGRVTVEGKPAIDPDPELAKVTVHLTRDPDLISMPSPFWKVTGSGDFSSMLSPGDYRVAVRGLPANTYVKSIRMGAEDIFRSGLHVTGGIDSPLQVVISTDAGTVTGTVLDDSLRPFSNATVALVPDAPDQRSRPEFYRNTTSDSDGNFRLSAIPPGSYKLFAWEWAPPDSWQSGEFLRAYESSGKTLQVPSFGKLEGVQVNVIPRRK